MTIYFNAKEVEQFLINTGNSFASLCWHNDKVVNGAELISQLETSKWFQRYFPSNVNQYLFGILQSQVLQYSE